MTAGRGDPSLKRPVGETSGGSSDEDHILLASLAREGGAADHWQRWLSNNRLDDIDRNSFALLPLVYQNLSSQGYTGEEFGKLRGIYRQAWFKNQLLVELTGQTMGVLDQDGVASVAIDDLALLRWAQADLGDRAIGQARLLVPAPTVTHTLDRAQELGWKLTNGDYPDMRMQRSKGLYRSDGLRLQIHWYFLGRHPYAGLSDPLWQEARDGWIEQPDVRTLCITDQLLSTLVGGFNARPDRSLRWIPDALCLIRSSQVDWERLARLAEEMRVRLVVRDGLHRVSQYYEDEVPAPVIGRLSDVSTSARVHHWFRLQASAPSRWRSASASWVYSFLLASTRRVRRAVRSARL